MYIFLYNESKQVLKIDFRNTYFEDSEQSTEFRGAFSIQFNAKKYFASLLTNYTPFFTLQIFYNLSRFNFYRFNFFLSKVS